MGIVNIREERIELTAVDKMSGVFGQAQNSINQLRSSMDTAKNAFIALAAIGAAGSFAYAIRNTIAWEAELLRLSQRTATTVEDLSALTDVAKIAGTDMDGVAKGLQKLAKSMAGVGEGDSKPGKVFEALKIAVTNVNGSMRPAIQVAQELGAKLASMKDQTLALAFAQETMGKGGANLLPFLYELGHAGDLHSKVLTDQAKAAKQFEDNLVRLEASSKQLKIAFANDLVPSLNEVTSAMLEAKKAGEGFFGVVAAGIQTGLTGTDAHKHNVELVEATNALLNAQNLFDRAKATYIQTSAPFDADQIKRFYREMLTAEAEVNRLRGIKPIIAPEPKPTAIEKQIDVANPLGARSAETERLRKLAEQTRKDLVDVDEKIARAIVLQADSDDQMVGSGKGLEDYDKMWKQIFETIDMGQEEAIAQGKELVDSFTEAERTAAAEAERFGTTIDFAFDRAVRGGGDLLGIVKDLGKELAMIEIKKRLFDPASKGLSALLDSFLKGGSSGGGGEPGPAAFAASSDSFNAAYQSVDWAGSFAHGTNYVPRTGIALVHQGEKITPAGQNNGGSINIVQHIHVDSRSDRASIIQAMHFAKEQAKAEIADSLNRGSPRFTPR